MFRVGPKLSGCTIWLAPRSMSRGQAGATSDVVRRYAESSPRLAALGADWITRHLADGGERYQSDWAEWCSWCAYEDLDFRGSSRLGYLPIIYGMVSSSGRYRGTRRGAQIMPRCLFWGPGRTGGTTCPPRHDEKVHAAADTLWDTAATRPSGARGALLSAAPSQYSYYPSWPPGRWRSPSVLVAPPRSFGRWPTRRRTEQRGRWSR